MSGFLCREMDYCEPDKQMRAQAAPVRGGTFLRSFKQERVEHAFGLPKAPRSS
jgi:hypothetical protein